VTGSHGHLIIQTDENGRAASDRIPSFLIREVPGDQTKKRFQFGVALNFFPYRLSIPVAYGHQIIIAQSMGDTQTTSDIENSILYRRLTAPLQERFDLVRIETDAITEKWAEHVATVDLFQQPTARAIRMALSKYTLGRVNRALTSAKFERDKFDLLLYYKPANFILRVPKDAQTPNVHRSVTLNLSAFMQKMPVSRSADPRDLYIHHRRSNVKYTANMQLRASTGLVTTEADNVAQAISCKIDTDIDYFSASIRRVRLGGFISDYDAQWAKAVGAKATDPIAYPPINDAMLAHASKSIRKELGLPDLPPPIHYPRDDIYHEAKAVIHSTQMMMRDHHDDFGNVLDVVIGGDYGAYMGVPGATAVPAARPAPVAAVVVQVEDEEDLGLEAESAS
jgi:hypothetical protein